MERLRIELFGELDNLLTGDCVVTEFCDLSDLDVLEVSHTDL
jgi:hypothetical protein